MESENFHCNSMKNYEDFDVLSYKFESKSSSKRTVKVAVIQTSVEAEDKNIDGLPTKFFEKLEEIIDKTAVNGGNILAFPELFYMPYPFSTPNLINWRKYGEAEKGSCYLFMQRMSIKHNIVIIYSILELTNENEYYNTCMVMSNKGEIIGKYRKFHIPPIEAPYLTPGHFDDTVISTDFGKIGILICYERHFPLKWLLLASNGAEIIFNPSSEDEGSLSHKMWKIEALNAAVSNGVFTVAINRCGKEEFNENIFNYFGTSYVASPDGSMFIGKSTTCILIAEIDLNMVDYVKEEYSFHKNQMLDIYAEKLRLIGRDEANNQAEIS